MPRTTPPPLARQSPPPRWGGRMRISRSPAPPRGRAMVRREPRWPGTVRPECPTLAKGIKPLTLRWGVAQADLWSAQSLQRFTLAREAPVAAVAAASAAAWQRQRQSSSVSSRCSGGRSSSVGSGRSRWLRRRGAGAVAGASTGAGAGAERVFPSATAASAAAAIRAARTRVLHSDFPIWTDRI